MFLTPLWSIRAGSIERGQFEQLQFERCRTGNRLAAGAAVLSMLMRSGAAGLPVEFAV
jgi:hypothetical protein